MGKRILVYALRLGGEKAEKADMKGAIKRDEPQKWKSTLGDLSALADSRLYKPRKNRLRKPPRKSRKGGLIPSAHSV